MSELLAGFNLRVYGVLLTPARDSVLLIDEHVMGRDLRKFPGGGVEHAEAPGSALVREFREELGVEVQLGPLFHVSPLFHRSLFRPQQLVALYWEVSLSPGQPEPRPLVPKMVASWRPVHGIVDSELTHPVDREVINILKGRCGAP